MPVIITPAERRDPIQHRELQDLAVAVDAVHGGTILGGKRPSMIYMVYDLTTGLDLHGHLYEALAGHPDMATVAAGRYVAHPMSLWEMFEDRNAWVVMRHYTHAICCENHDLQNLGEIRTLRWMWRHPAVVGPLFVSETFGLAAEHGLDGAKAVQELVNMGVDPEDINNVRRVRWTLAFGWDERVLVCQRAGGDGAMHIFDSTEIGTDGISGATWDAGRVLAGFCVGVNRIDVMHTQDDDAA